MRRFRLSWGGAALTGTARHEGRPEYPTPLLIPCFVHRVVGERGEDVQLLKAAEDLVSDTKIPSIITHTDESMTHLDILFAAPEHNTFVSTAVSFLTSLD